MDAAVDLYVCPACHGRLDFKESGFFCARCQRRYPLRDGIPDFLIEVMGASRQLQQMERFLTCLARFYETKLWYQTVIDLYAGWRVTTLAELIRLITAMVAIDRGLVLDVACGPGTYGRQMASAERTVYGIDLSLSMLRQGRRLVEREGRRHVHFSRAHVEQLPFPDQAFDAVICCGSLHLFPDTLRALREIARTARSGAPLAAMTFMPGPGGLLKYRWAQRRLRERRGFHVFEVSEMAGYLQQAGFTDYAPQAFGSLLVFSARRT